MTGQENMTETTEMKEMKEMTEMTEEEKTEADSKEQTETILSEEKAHKQKTLVTIAIKQGTGMFNVMIINVV